MKKRTPKKVNTCHYCITKEAFDNRITLPCCQMHQEQWIKHNTTTVVLHTSAFSNNVSKDCRGKSINWN